MATKAKARVGLSKDKKQYVFILNGKVKYPVDIETEFRGKIDRLSPNKYLKMIEKEYQGLYSLTKEFKELSSYPDYIPKMELEAPVLEITTPIIKQPIKQTEMKQETVNIETGEMNPKVVTLEDITNNSIQPVETEAERKHKIRVEARKKTALTRKLKAQAKTEALKEAELLKVKEMETKIREQQNLETEQAKSVEDSPRTNNVKSKLNNMKANVKQAAPKVAGTIGNAVIVGTHAPLEIVFQTGADILQGCANLVTASEAKLSTLIGQNIVKHNGETFYVTEEQLKHIIHDRTKAIQGIPVKIVKAPFNAIRSIGAMAKAVSQAAHNDNLATS